MVTQYRQSSGRRQATGTQKGRPSVNPYGAAIARRHRDQEEAAAAADLDPCGHRPAVRPDLTCQRLAGHTAGVHRHDTANGKTSYTWTEGRTT